MTPTRKIGVIVGSLRKESLTRKMANAIVDVAPAGLEFAFIDIGDLALYNQDLDDGGTPPSSWGRLREEVRELDAVLFMTPEYNRSLPGVLKNAIDVGSRPYGKSVWDGKPAAVVSVAPKSLGAFGANHHLRQTLVFLNMPALQQPEAYIGNAEKMFDAGGKLANESTKEFLTKFARAFADWIELHVERPAGVPG